MDLRIIDSVKQVREFIDIRAVIVVFTSLNKHPRFLSFTVTCFLNELFFIRPRGNRYSVFGSYVALSKPK